MTLSLPIVELTTTPPDEMTDGRSEGGTRSSSFKAISSPTLRFGGSGTGGGSTTVSGRLSGLPLNRSYGNIHFNRDVG